MKMLVIKTFLYFCEAVLSSLLKISVIMALLYLSESWSVSVNWSYLIAKIGAVRGARSF